MVACVLQLSECYAKVRDWREVVSWDARVETLKKQHPEMEGAFKVHVNIDQIKLVHLRLIHYVYSTDTYHTNSIRILQYMYVQLLDCFFSRFEMCVLKCLGH